MGFTFWDRPLLERLKEEVRKAEERGDSVFKFGGEEFYVPYAKYLIEYLDKELPQ